MLEPPRRLRGLRRRARRRRRLARPRRRPGAGRARPLRLRQVDAAARGRRPGAADRRRRRRGTARDLAGVPTHKRGFALMFQDGQLFGHLTVARNVGYALRLRRAPRHRRPGRRAARAGRPRGVRRPAARDPVRRRAAAGRAGPVAGRASPGCCCSTSRCPPSTPGCASGWPATCAAILREAGTTALMVTHDHEEAFAVADRIAVMRAGRVVQQGADRRGLARAGRPGDGAVPRLRPRCSTDAAAATLLAAAGLPPAAAVAIRRSALWSSRRPARCPARSRSSRITPEQVRLEVDVDGVGSMDAVAPARRTPRAGRRGAAHCRRAPGSPRSAGPDAPAPYTWLSCIAAPTSCSSGRRLSWAAWRCSRRSCSTSSSPTPRASSGPSWLRLPMLAVRRVPARHAAPH